MSYKKYEGLLWIGGVLLVVAFIYYFATILLLGGWRFFSPKVKLSKQEKEMVNRFESDCNCGVRLQHKYDLIENKDGKQFYSSDKILSITFTADLNSTVLPCSDGDEILKHHAIQVVSEMMKTISYKSYYAFMIVFYRTNDFRCERVARFKITGPNSIEFVSMRY